MNIYLLMATIVLWIAALVSIAAYRSKTKKSLKQAINYIDDAILGKKISIKYDESMESALIKKLVQYIEITTEEKKQTDQERESVKSLVSDITHQTKTPLSNILLLTELIQEDPLVPEASMVKIRQVHTQSKKLEMLIESLVKTSYLESGLISVSPVTDDLSLLIHDICVETGQIAALKNISIAYMPTEVFCTFDPKWTREALINVIDNAIKYSPENTKINIKVEPLELFTRIDIIDSGMGIEEQEHGQIFQRFYRSPSVSGEDGLGIGLYLARKILSLEGGYIKVQSTPGKGSCFSIYLPC